MKATTYLVTIEEPYEGLGLQQVALECTSVYVVRMTPRQHSNLLQRLDALEITDTDGYEYAYDDHYGIVGYSVQKRGRLRGANDHAALLRFINWRTPKPDGPQGMLLNKNQPTEKE